MPTSAPVRPAVWANTTTISATDSPLTPKARNRAVLRLSAPSVRTISSTPCCQSRTARSASPAEVARGPAEVLAGARRAGPCRRPATARTPSARSAAASACSRISVSRPDSTATVTRSACCGLPLTALTTRSRSRPTLVSSDAQQLAGADELLPAGQHLAAQQGAVGRGLVDRRRSRRSYAASASARSRARRRPARRRASATSWVRRARVRIAPSSVCLTTAARASASAASDGRASRGCRRPPRPAAARRRRPVPSVTVNSGESLRPRAGEHPGQVGGDRVDGLRRGAVEHDRHRGRLRSAAWREEVPRHLVGVAGGRGDEEPQVGGGEQLGGQRPVALLDRVDVGGVEDRQARRAPLAAATSWRAAGSLVARCDPLEVGQQPVLAEPAGVVGVVHQHRRAGGRPEHAGLGDPACRPGS